MVSEGAQKRSATQAPSHCFWINLIIALLEDFLFLPPLLMMFERLKKGSGEGS